MRGINDFIIKVESEYENEIEVAGKRLILTSIFEDAKQLVKVGEVMSTPINNNTNIKEGDIITFHHLITRTAFDGSDKKVNSEYILDPINKLYLVPEDMIYSYIRNDEVFMISPYVFVEPIVSEDTVLPSGIILPTGGEEIPQVGILRYSNSEQVDYSVGDTVIFEKDSEYEVKVNGERLYRMRNEWILAKYES